MMTADEFASRMIGVPWRRWAADFDAVDCFGLVVLYWREVLGIDIGEVPHMEIAAGFSVVSGWRETYAKPGACGFMTWASGAPTHCGILLPGDRLLHAQAGSPVPESGSVRLTRLAAVRRVCPDIRFYAYEPC